MLGAVYATTRGTLGWRHAFGDTTPFSTFAFAGGSAFNIAGVPIAREAAVVNAGIDFALTKAATVGLSYGGQFGGNAADQNVRGQLTVQF
jgi:outer membrane autotransporter protein